MSDFKCSPGKVLTRAETEDMLNYDEAGVARPEEYADVVFDATSIRGAVYRCKTEAEQEASKRVVAADEAGRARQAKIEELKAQKREQLANDLGIDAASIPIDMDPAQALAFQQTVESQDAAAGVKASKAK